MRRFVYLIIPTIFIFSSCGNSPQVITSNKKKDSIISKKQIDPDLKNGLVDGIEIIKGNRTPYDMAEGRRGDTILHSTYKGEFTMTDSLNQNKKALFDLKSEFMVDKVYVIPLKNDRWFISWQETDHEGVKSYCAVYKTAGLKPEWKFAVHVPNPGQPVLDGSYAYISYLGFAGKISTDDGKFAWKYDSLFNTDKQPFKKIEKALVYNKKVEFIDLPIPGKRERRDTLKVNPESGERIK